MNSLRKLDSLQSWNNQPTGYFVDGYWPKRRSPLQVTNTANRADEMLRKVFSQLGQSFKKGNIEIVKMQDMKYVVVYLACVVVIRRGHTYCRTNSPHYASRVSSVRQLLCDKPIVTSGEYHSGRAMLVLTTNNVHIMYIFILTMNSMTDSIDKNVYVSRTVKTTNLTCCHKLL